jgi:general secretion pathway protein D
LSDIETFFFVQAAQGDTRSNVLQAPKVTLFNGQQAFVADAVSQPFVIGVIPVVGEFVAAQQPVIVVLNEGTMMTIQAVVSDDRRYVRLTVVPFFTEVGDVQEFTFEGSSSTTSSSSSTDDDDDGKNEQQEKSDQATRTGVTVQLPAFQFISVVTTVSVPDGGTVLLGGIKRLSEGRNEFGVPLLSKVPYINRLFRNVAIGRETDSLMMMVTPRIIIQEEEEERLGIPVP